MTQSVFNAKYEQFRSMLVSQRASLGLTQAGLAVLLSKPQSFVSKYERGERRLDLIEFLGLAKVLGINVHEFIDRLDLPSEDNSSEDADLSR